MLQSFNFNNTLFTIDTDKREVKLQHSSLQGVYEVYKSPSFEDSIVSKTITLRPTVHLEDVNGVLIPGTIKRLNSRVIKGQEYLFLSNYIYW